MSDAPKISVVALCYNHASYVLEALHSLLTQTFRDFELIIVEDCGTDSSVSLIKSFVQEFSHTFKYPIHCVFNEINKGNCLSFNSVIPLLRGKYVIDFATDDRLHPNRLELQYQFFERLDEEVGMIYSNVNFINEAGESIGKKYVSPPEFSTSAWIYPQMLLPGGHISAPSMMIKTSVLRALKGYDPELSYEDFDFWIRCSRVYKCVYQDLILTDQRRIQHSHRAGFTKKGKNQHLFSTVKVYEKAYHLNRSLEEWKNWEVGLKYYLFQAVWLEDDHSFSFAYDLLSRVKLTKYSSTEKLLLLAKKWKLPRYSLYLFLKNIKQLIS